MSLRTANELFERMNSDYSVSRKTLIGRSWLSRDIFSVTAGDGNHRSLVAGGMCGGDLSVAEFLSELSLRLDGSLSDGRRIGDLNIRNLCASGSVSTIAAVNPDGLFLRTVGIKEDNPFYGRVQRISGGSPNFENWEANIRGVSVFGNFNYKWVDRKLEERRECIFANAPRGYYGEFPESELESSSICGYCRKLQPGAVLEIRSGERTSLIPFSDSESQNAAKVVRAYSGVEIMEDSSAFFGSLSGWASSVFGCRSAIMTLGEGFSSEVCMSAVLLFFAM